MARKGSKINQQEELDKLAEKLGLPPRDPNACYACSLCNGILPVAELHIIRQEDNKIYICNSCLTSIQKGEIKKEIKKREDTYPDLTKLVEDILEREVPKRPTIGDSPIFPQPPNNPYYPYYSTIVGTGQNKYISSGCMDPLDRASSSISVI